MSDATTPAQRWIPADDPQRHLTVARPQEDETLPHVGLVGDTYTILVSGDDTAGQYTLIDMHVPPGGGPPPHRHDFEEMFTVLEGEVELSFRGEHLVARAGETVNVPANAPHGFRNASGAPARLLCMCSPPGQEQFFIAVGTPVRSLDGGALRPWTKTPRPRSSPKPRSLLRNIAPSSYCRSGRAVIVLDLRPNRSSLGCTCCQSANPPTVSYCSNEKHSVLP